MITNKDIGEDHTANLNITKPLLIPITNVEKVAIANPLPEEPEKPAPKQIKPIAYILTGLGVGAVVAIAFGYRYWQYASTHQSTDNASVVGHIHQVSSKIAGTVTYVLVSDNQQVQSGQLLVKLDPKDYENKVQEAEAALESAKRTANAAQANIDLASETTSGRTSQAQGNVGIAQASIANAQAIAQEAQAGIPLAQAQVEQANASLENAQTDYNRNNILYKEGAISSQQLGAVKTAYEVALAQKNSAIQSVQQAQARLAQAQEGITSAQAKLSGSRGELAQAAASGQQTTVNRSEYEAAQSAIAQSGAVLKDAQLQLAYIDIQVGSPLMAVVENNYWIVANFKETQLNRIKAGQSVEVRLDAFPEQVFMGRVESISPASGAQFALLPPDNATGNFTKIVQRISVKITLEPQSLKGYESRITAGMSAEVTVEIK
ncbi:HlyD family secretion protein [Tumidithrix elongata RA019]|uniref:HlyD family secretion protein n=1 Tax=Tumidithrix elongata BACA0141 TaxID=2716417 RepID=A0AAW9Q2C0_9CYAN|nr:HlyD family secretion protein [Tumidithrix elongata RA019]